jgi:hypothetical protein
MTLDHFTQLPDICEYHDDQDFMNEDPEVFCAMSCEANESCCNDLSISSNQYISCTQACMIRIRGSDYDECTSNCETRECDSSINSFSYSRCGTCADLDESCPHGVQDPSDCFQGCSMA